MDPTKLAAWRFVLFKHDGFDPKIGAPKRCG
jgi:hypothetical protein